MNKIPTSGKKKLSTMKNGIEVAIYVPVQKYNEFLGISINTQSYH
ncbi:MAG: hypothetical protein RSF02_00890 [Bacilli bacterium]